MAMPKEPRQMMINMMYLVLTAMLAMNVSAEILNAFNIVNNGIVNTQNALKNKNDLTYKIIKDQHDINGAKAQIAFERSAQAKQIADKLYNEIEKYKQEIITKAEGYEPETHRLHNEKDLDAAGDIFIGKDESGAVGSAVQKRINDTRVQLVSLLKNIKGVTAQDLIKLDKQIALRAEDEKEGENELEKKWWFHNFHSVPAVAGVTILNGLEQQIRTAEADVINELLKTIGKTDFKFDTLTAQVVPDGPTIITVGQQFKANAFLSAFNSKDNPIVTVNGSNVPVEGGEGKVTLGGGEGEHEYSVDISLKDPTGVMKVYKTKGKYQVIKPFGSVSADKMNVVYKGVPNPVTITAAGFTADKISATISAGTIVPDPSAGPGKYIITQSASVQGGADVTVFGKDAKGGTATVGKFNFRVKQIPDPVAKIGGSQGGKIATSLMKAQTGIAAVLDNFDFNCPFVVQKYDCVFIKKRQDAKVLTDIKGLMFTEDVLRNIKSAQPGDIIIFDRIVARGCDGTPRNLATLTFTFN
jgi:gliding motility-associated protein GldM